MDAEDLDELISWARDRVRSMRDFEREAIEALANHAAIGSDQATTNAKKEKKNDIKRGPSARCLLWREALNNY